MSNFLPSLITNPGDPYFVGAVFGLILSLPIALFLAYWMSGVRNKVAVTAGAFMGALLGFIGILGWVDTLVFSTPLPNTNGVATFFGAIFICSILGLVGAIVTNLLVARINRQRVV